MHTTIDEAINILKEQKPVIIFDSENENEGDLVYPSEIITTDIIKFMMNKCRGIICQTLEENVITEKQIPIFKKSGKTKTGQTNFVYPIDHVEAHSGISCNDRVLTIKALLDPTSKPTDFVIPGHQNLLKISPNGVLDRQGHTESSSDLVHLAGYKKSATICELIDEEGIPLDYSGVMKFSTSHSIPVVMLVDIHKYFLHEHHININPFITYEKNPYEKLKHKVCVLTGGSSGIGKAIKELLETNDCKVINLSRSSDTPCDITKLEDIQKCLSNISTVDYIINCAGHIDVNNIDTSTLDDWKYHFDVNVFAPFTIIRQCLPFTNSESTIINICSPSAHKTRIGWSAYCASKAALHSFTANYASELNISQSKLKIFAISPSKTNTPMIHKLFPDINDKCLIHPKDIANLTINILARRDLIENGQTFEIKKEYND